MASSSRTHTQIKAWANELVDLSRRNTSLFYKPIKRGTLQIESPAPVAVLERLKKNQQWNFFIPPHAVPGAPAWTTADSLDRARPEELVTERTTRTDVEATLKNLARLANLDLADRGLESLYLCFGMLHWRREDDAEDNRSPLLFIPVQLVRNSPREPYRLARLENDPVLNLSLRVLLEQEFNLQLADFDPGQTQELELGELWEGVGQSVRARGWRVEPTVVLKRATFHKEAMFKDLTENIEVIAQHRVVQSLASPDAALPSSASPPEESELDDIAPPERSKLILDADGSQRRAIAAAARGVSFVMDGPPGTGKSQTIANMIAELMSAGKTVLFVSEKVAALQVVAGRLHDRGLHHFLLELHGQKVGRREVAERLGEALRRRPVGQPRMSDAQLARAEKLRRRLTGYAAAVNIRRDPLGRSVEQVIGRLAQLADVPAAPTPTNVSERLSAEAAADLLERFERLSRVWSPVDQRANFIWRGLLEEHTSARTRPDLTQLVDQLDRSLGNVVDLSDQLAEETALRAPDQLSDAEWLAAIVAECGHQPNTDRSWWTSTEISDALARLNQLEFEAQEHRADIAALEDAYGDAWDELQAADAERFRQGRESTASGLVANPGPSIQELRHQVDALRETVAFAEQLNAGAKALALALGAPARERTIDECAALAFVAGYADADVRPDTRWSSPVVISRVQAALDVLGPLVQRYQNRKAALNEVFTPEVEELDLAGLVVRFEQRHTGLRKMSGAFREDKRAVASVARVGKATKEVRAHLREALDLQEAGRELDDAYARSGDILGSYAHERATDVDAASRALGILRDAADRLREDYDAAGVAAQLCGEAPRDPGLADQAARTSRQIAEWRAGAGATLFGGAASVPLTLDQLIEAARQTESSARDLLELADAVAELRHDPADLAVLEEELARRAAIAARNNSLLERESRDRRLFGVLYDGFDTDIGATRVGLEWVRDLQKLHGGPLSKTAANQLHDREPAADAEPLHSSCENTRKILTALLDMFDQPRAAQLKEEFEADFSTARAATRDLAARIDQVDEWRAHVGLFAGLRKDGWNPTLDYAVSERIRADHLVDVLERALWTAWYNAVSANDAALDTIRADDLIADVEQFRELDHAILTDAAQRVAEACAARRPNTSVGQAKIIEKEGQKKTRHMPVRLLLDKTMAVTHALKPCFLMSPLSVSEFLPPGFSFDAVIFDEASQVTPADAINCVYRGGQLIVAGDDKQLPPTSFFDKAGIDDTDSYEEDQLDDFESVLGLCKGTAGLYSVPLQWHYRSQHESLIDFSNRHFYDTQLVTFPAAKAAGGALGVEFRHVDGVYEGGTSRTNRLEAEAVAHRVIERATQLADESLGVVTFSQAQAEAVENAVDRLRLDRPELDHFFMPDGTETFFVKALENVQGDERDVILFSVGYGPQGDGSFSANFGPLNRKGGERRLNVAVTRARKKVELFASFQPEQLADKAKAVGLQRLLDYMRYARQLQTGGATAHGVDPADEALAGVVADVIRSWGYDVDLGVGMSSYRLDVAVRDPEQPGSYLLGVELDGASYASSAVARDRERLRQEVLGRLGWRVHRVWGPAWYLDRSGSEQRLRDALLAAERSEAPPSIPELRSAVELHEVDVDLDAAPDWTQEYVPHWPSVNSAVHPAEPEAMSDLTRAVAEVVAAEAPVTFDLVLKRISWQYQVNATKRVREATERAVATLQRRGDLRRQGETLLSDGPIVVRVPSGDDEDTYREINQIPVEELRQAIVALVRDARAMSQEELVNAVARLFGFKRTGAKIRQALEEATADLLADGLISSTADGTLRHEASAELQEMDGQELRRLVAHGESYSLEFKSSLRTDVNSGSVIKELEKVVIKTVAGFLNAGGGTLLIGVADDGSIVGLEADYKSIKKPGRDGFELHLTQMLSNGLGTSSLAYVTVAFVTADGRDVCRVDVRRSPEPVYVADKQGSVFYARLGNATRPMQVDEAHRYIREHWGR